MYSIYLVYKIKGSHVTKEDQDKRTYFITSMNILGHWSIWGNINGSDEIFSKFQLLVV